jgi:hypothetical protein
MDMRHCWNLIEELRGHIERRRIIQRQKMFSKDVISPNNIDGSVHK